jgi:AcrR family transcriptional regulator
MDTKKNILDTASRLFYHQGYNNTGINQIIEEAGVAKASLYQHFKSKEDLLMEYLEVVFEQTMQRLRDAAAKKSVASERISAIFKFVSEYTNSKDFCGCNFLNIAAEVPKENRRIYTLIQHQKNEIRNLFTEILVTDAKGKDARQKSANLADEIYLLFDGALMSCKIYGNSWPVTTAHKAALRLL